MAATMISPKVSAKRCFNCHKDVTTDKRMKDASGRYWCVTCGAEQQKNKAIARSRKKTEAGMSPDKKRLVKVVGVIGLLVAAAVVRFTMM